VLRRDDNIKTDVKEIAWVGLKGLYGAR